MADTVSLLIHENAKWEIDLSRRELRSHGVPMPIGRRAFDIIAALARANGEVVTKAFKRSVGLRGAHDVAIYDQEMGYIDHI